jgi:hypothetical protein
VGDANRTDLDDLISLLRASRVRRSTEAPTCPDEHRLAAFVDGSISPAEADEFESHLADCQTCLDLVGLLSRQGDMAAAEPFPETDIARACRLLERGPRSRGGRAPQWAVAASVVLGTFVVWTQYTGRPGSEGPAQPLPERTTRQVESQTLDPEVTAPRAGSTVDIDELSFRWSPVAGSEYYDVRIVSDSGAIVLVQRVETAEWRPGTSLNLQPGRDYFVLVEAHPSQVKTSRSDHVPFRVTE